MTQQNQGSDKPNPQPNNQQQRDGNDHHQRKKNGGFNKPRSGYHQSGTTNVQEGDADALKNSMMTGIRDNDDDYLEAKQGDENSPLHPIKPFDEIITGPMAGPILQVIDDLNFFQPSKIQSQAIPILNNEKMDLIAQAQSGSGKTVAFLVSMLLHVDGEKHCPQTICLCHTRELTMQTFKVFSDMNKYTKFTGDVCVKNDNESETPPQKDAQLLFGTPSSFTYWIKNGGLDVSQVNFLVIDEADAMLDKNSTLFPSTGSLLNRLLPQNAQYAFFSATFKNSIIEFIKKMRPNIITIRLQRSQQRVETIEHWFTRVKDQAEGFNVIFDLVSSVAKGQTYVFTRSKQLVTDIAKYLNEKGISCKAFSSNLTSKERDETLDQFRNEEFKVLITSDVLARGIDIPNTYLVINYQTPIQFVPPPKNRYVYPNQNQNQGRDQKRIFPDCDTYYHRAGRAGRFGRSGLCFTIVTDDKDQDNLKSFCSSLQLNIPLHTIDPANLKKLPEEKEVSEPVANSTDDNPAENAAPTSNTA